MPLYAVERKIIEPDRPFGDGQHIIYVNGAYRDDETELGKLMHDFSCTDPDEMYNEVLANKARFFKQDEKGVANMCKALEDMRNEARDEVRVENAQKMLNDGMPIEKVVEYTGLTLEKVRELADKKSA